MTPHCCTSPACPETTWLPDDVVLQALAHYLIICIWVRDGGKLHPASETVKTANAGVMACHGVGHRLLAPTISRPDRTATRSRTAFRERLRTPGAQIQATQSGFLPSAHAPVHSESGPQSSRDPRGRGFVFGPAPPDAKLPAEGSHGPCISDVLAHNRHSLFGHWCKGKTLPVVLIPVGLPPPVDLFPGQTALMGCQHLFHDRV